MANLFKLLLRCSIFAKGGNLVALDDAYSVIARLLRQHRVTGILDAGASHGRVARKFLRLFPEACAYAFEPNPIYRDRLERCANEDGRFRPQFLALSDKEGSIDLQVTRSPGTTSIFVPGKRLKAMYPEETDVTSIERIEAVTIDGWAERNDNPDIQLMKFDIQGAELKALRGATSVLQRSALLVYTEILFNPLYDGGTIHSEVDLCLREFGFVIYDIYKPRYDKNRALMWANAIFVHADRLGI